MIFTTLPPYPAVFYYIEIFTILQHDSDKRTHLTLPSERINQNSLKKSQRGRQSTSEVRCSALRKVEALRLLNLC